MKNKKPKPMILCPECSRPLFMGHYYDKGNGKRYPACYHCYADMGKHFTKEKWESKDK